VEVANDVAFGVAACVADTVGDVIADEAEDPVVSDNPGEGDGVESQDTTMNPERSRMPAARCMSMPLSDAFMLRRQPGAVVTYRVT
jgi:hypothetical protein